ncbi:transposase family protein [Streptomyces sp. NPDC052164]|uniref:transposase family protein n=1 Tax=Streptomyces sp. NPDC052164 TaxID=3155529 RepID=UPI003419DAB4
MNQPGSGKVAVLVAPSSDPSAPHLPQAASGASRPEAVVPSGLLDALAQVPDPRNPRGVRFRPATLLAVGVCALPSAGHNSLTAMAEWVRRCDQDVLARTGYTGLQARPISATTPDGTVEREQRRAHRTAQHGTDPPRPRRTAFAVDGKCLRGAVRADGSRVFVLFAVRHHDALTAAPREIGAKTNEIPEFAPLLDTLDDQDLTDSVVTVDALHAETSHTRYLVQDRQAHCLLSVKNNQPAPARQLTKLPWKQVPGPRPVPRPRARPGGGPRGEGGECGRTVVPPCPPGCSHPPRTPPNRHIEVADRDCLRRHRSRDPSGVSRRDRAWARGHWIIENTVHWTKDVTFAEDAGRIRRHRTPAVMSALRDLARATLLPGPWAPARTRSSQRSAGRPDPACSGIDVSRARHEECGAVFVSRGARPILIRIRQAPPAASRAVTLDGGAGDRRAPPEFSGHGPCNP